MKKKGFGLIEVLLSTAILVFTTAAVITLGNIATRGSVLNQSRITAYNLAQEGIEAVRAIRDTNYIDENANTNWGEGLNNTSGKVEWNGSKFVIVPGSETIPKSQINFTRTVSVTNIDDHSKNVGVVVSWDELGQSHRIILNTILTNWRLEG